MSSIHDATPLQLAELVKRRERLARIASRAMPAPIIAKPVETVMVEKVRPRFWFYILDAERPLIARIQIAVSEESEISRTDLISARRTGNLIIPRQIAMYLAKVMTTKSLPEIGRRFGGRDHTTVLHAVRKIDRLILSDPILAARIEAIRNTLEIQ